MKVIGLIGGMSWESSALYYRLINETVRTHLGGLSSAPCLMFSLNFEEIAALQRQGRWQEAGDRLAEVAVRLEHAGAECIVVCTNTMHKLAERIAAAISVPFLHIAEATAQAIRARGLRRVGLLGTAFTMEQDFYKRYLAEHHGIEVLVPEAGERSIIHRVIYDELCVGRIDETSKVAYEEIMHALVERGAEGIILGCTEISLLVQTLGNVPIFDTTQLHAHAAAAFALGLESNPVTSREVMG